MIHSFIIYFFFLSGTIETVEIFNTTELGVDESLGKFTNFYKYFLKDLEISQLNVFSKDSIQYREFPQ